MCAPSPRAAEGMLTTVLAHLLPDEGTDLLLLPGTRRARAAMGDGAIQEEEKPFPQGLAEPRGEGSPYLGGSGMDPAPFPPQ